MGIRGKLMTIKNKAKSSGNKNTLELVVSYDRHAIII